MIGEKVVITVEEWPKGMMGEIIKIDHQLGLYGIRENGKGGGAASLWWFNKEEFEVLEDEA